MTWRQLGVYVRHLPRESATARVMHGDHVEWGLQEHLLALNFDALNVANWQRTAKKGSKPPKPFPRPGVATGTKIGKTTRAPEEVAELLRRNARG